MLNGTGQWRRSSLPPWAGRQSSRRREIPPQVKVASAEGPPSVFVTSAQANRSAAHSRIASPNQETLCWSNRRRSTEIIGLVGAIVYAMLGEQLFLLEL
jgi:hypothetical protein